MRDLLREEGGEDASIDSIHVATTVSTIPCDRRKPSPGMVLEAMAAHGFAPDDTCFVGDTATDMQAAFRAGAGVTRVLVGTGYGEPVYEALLRVSAETETEGDDANVGGWMAKEKTKKRFVVDVPKADPTDTIPRETLPVTVCANVEEAADMLLETRVVEVEL
jgi:hypothetical protein